MILMKSQKQENKVQSHVITLVLSGRSCAYPAVIKYIELLFLLILLSLLIMESPSPEMIYRMSGLGALLWEPFLSLSGFHYA